MKKAWVKFYPDKVDKVRRGTISKLQMAGAFAVEKIKQNLSVMGNGIPSRPGQFPRYQTGKLYKSIRWERSNKYGIKILANAFYGLYLEFGTSKMQPRPFMRRTLWNIRASIRNILAGKRGIQIVSQNV